MAAVLAISCGCGKSPPPQFTTNMQDIYEQLKGTYTSEQMHDPSFFVVSRSDLNNADIKLSENSDPDLQRKKSEAKDKINRVAALKQVATVTYAFFGTPDEPYVLDELKFDRRKIELAAGPTFGNETGTQRGLYRQHCAHCHGITGDGAGPTAAFLNPYPRDYRRGTFKFKSTALASKPTHADLKRIVLDGIAGTAMPSFGLLPNDQVESLVEYVKFLSIRGEFERSLAAALLINEELQEEKDGRLVFSNDRSEIITSVLTPLVEQWKAAADDVVVPEVPPQRPSLDTPEGKKALEDSIAAGKKLFEGPLAQCVKCHGPTGLGDGSDVKLFDVWNEFKKDPADRFTWLLPKQELMPRNLRLGIYRGGRRPMDLYRRIFAGIPGTPMPAAGPSKNDDAEAAKKKLQPEQIWNIVDYVRSLPYEALSTPAGTSGEGHAPLHAAL